MASLGPIKLVLSIILAVCVLSGGLGLWFWPEREEASTAGDVEHVLIIGIDGLTARAMHLGDTRFIENLAAHGAYIPRAMAVLPTASGPNWGAVLMGSGPKATKIRGNDWRWEDWQDEQFCDRVKGAGWPTLFDLVEEQIPDARTVVVHHWIGIKRFFRPGAVDKRKFGVWDWRTMRIAKRILRRGPPTLMFVHLDAVDAAGHDFGYDGWKYHREVDRADAKVATLMSALEQSGKLDRTLVAIVSDHGGVGHRHGGADPRERLVPLVFFGSGIAAGSMIETGVHLPDIAPTIAHAMGLETPDCWTGTPLTAIFEKTLN